MVARSTSAFSIFATCFRRRDGRKMRPIHLRVRRVGVDRIEADLVFLDFRIVQRLLVVEVAGDLDARRQAFGKEMFIAEILLVLLQRARS